MHGGGRAKTVWGHFQASLNRAGGFCWLVFQGTGGIYSTGGSGAGGDCTGGGGGGGSGLLRLLMFNLQSLALIDGDG